jgi:hypothetical protein
MKKIFICLAFIFAFTTVSFAQGGAEKSGGFFSRIFSKGSGKRSQMWHFDKKRKDRNMKNNGTSYRRNRKSGYKVDGNGFGVPNQNAGKKRKRKNSGIK